MWRRSSAGFIDDAGKNEDSDQSISEEEGPHGEWSSLNAVSLGGGENEEGKMQDLSQLERFREFHEVHRTDGSISSHGKKGVYRINDEVETPTLNDGTSSSRCHGIASASRPHSNEALFYLPHVASLSHSSDEEIISDDEEISPHTSRSSRDDLTITWSEANREMEALIRPKESARSVFVKEKKSTGGGGGRRKAKVKFSFPCHSDKKDLSLAVSDSNKGISSGNIAIADEIGAATDDEVDNFMAEYHDNRILPFQQAHEHGTKGHSMAEILSGYLEKSDQQVGSSELEIQKRSIEPTVSESDVSPLDDIIQEDGDLPEALASDTSFESENEENAQNRKSITSRTMADQFHEAFKTVSAVDDGLHVSFPRPLCAGMYRRLQEVMQIEKERDAHSLKIASAETGLKDEGMSISVRILSRSLEAKLIVCSCSCVGDGKNLSRKDNLEMKIEDITRTITIIFNPRISSDVDVEVGNLIHVHPPWYALHKLLPLCHLPFIIHAVNAPMFWSVSEQEGGECERSSDLSMLALLPGPALTLSIISKFEF